MSTVDNFLGQEEEAFNPKEGTIEFPELEEAKRAEELADAEKASFYTHVQETATRLGIEWNDRNGPCRLENLEDESHPLHAEAKAIVEEVREMGGVFGLIVFNSIANIVDDQQIELAALEEDDGRTFMWAIENMTDPTNLLLSWLERRSLGAHTPEASPQFNLVYNQLLPMAVSSNPRLIRPHSLVITGYSTCLHNLVHIGYTSIRTSTEAKLLTDALSAEGLTIQDVFEDCPWEVLVALYLADHRTLNDANVELMRDRTPKKEDFSEEQINEWGVYVESAHSLVWELLQREPAKLDDLITTLDEPALLMEAKAEILEQVGEYEDNHSNVGGELDVEGLQELRDSLSE